MSRDPEHEHLPPEPWVTKRQLADHLSVTPRWIELQQPLGLPRLSTGGLSRYRISEVEAWLRSTPESKGLGHLDRLTMRGREDGFC